MISGSGFSRICLGLGRGGRARILAVACGASQREDAGGHEVAAASALNCRVRGFSPGGGCSGGAVQGGPRPGEVVHDRPEQAALPRHDGQLNPVFLHRLDHGPSHSLLRGRQARSLYVRLVEHPLALASAPDGARDENRGADLGAVPRGLGGCCAPGRGASSTSRPWPGGSASPTPRSTPPPKGRRDWLHPRPAQLPAHARLLRSALLAGSPIVHAWHRVSGGSACPPQRRRCSATPVFPPVILLGVLSARMRWLVTHWDSSTHRLAMVRRGEALGGHTRAPGQRRAGMPAHAVPLTCS